jgi:hypothetical protein
MINNKKKPSITLGQIIKILVIIKVSIAILQLLLK